MYSNLILNPQQFGQSWSTSLKELGVYKKLKIEALLILIVIIEICKVGIGIGLPGEVWIEVLVPFL